MTRQALYEWVVDTHKCIPLPEIISSAPCLYVQNNKTKRRATLIVPIDDRYVKNMTVIATCTQLGIPVPPGLEDEAGYFNDIRQQ
jgi:hypothetical protein